MIQDLMRREYEIATAYDIGLDVPRIKYRDTNVDYPHTVDGSLTIERLDGVDVSFTSFWNNDKFSFWTGIINDKKLLTGQQGPELTANCVTVFPAKSKKIESVYNKLMKKFSGEKYTGFITLDLIIKDGRYYYDRIRFSVIPDVVCCIVQLAGMDTETLISCMESGEHMDKPTGYACSTRLYDYPYNVHGNRSRAVPYADKLIDIGDCFVATGRGDQIKTAWKHLYKEIKDIDMCYRLDGDYKARWTFNQLKRSKVI